MLNKRISNFELSGSQNISNALCRVVSFRRVQEKPTLFREAIKALRENSFYIILKNEIGNFMVIGLDQSIIGAWLNKNIKLIDQVTFDDLKQSTQPLITEITKHLSISDSRTWHHVRWETHPNFLAVMDAETEVTFFEFNIHIGRNTGKLCVFTTEKVSV